MRRDSTLDGWSTPLLAIMKSLMMTMGEYDYINTFIAKLYDNDERTLHFTLLSFLFLVLFIILMPILLMNLLVKFVVKYLRACR